jgi:hypothetical protein
MEPFAAGKFLAESHAPYYREYPLSGEWGGESISEIACRFDIDGDDWEDAFEAGYASVVFP